MDIEEFARLHPIAYVHLAYAVVWGLQFGYAAWIAVQWRRAGREERRLKLSETKGTNLI